MGSFLGAFGPLRSLKPVLETLLDRPRAVQEHFFSALEASKSTSRGLQELKRLQDRSKTPPGTDFNPSGTLRDLKLMIFRDPKVVIFW